MPAKKEVEHKETEKGSPFLLAFLVSKKSTGSNMQAVVEAICERVINCRVGLVISEESGVEAINVVEKYKIPLEVKTLKDRLSSEARESYGRELAELLNKNGIQIAVLEGFSIILSHSYFETFKGVTLNIHPGLIPNEVDRPFVFPDGTEAPWNRGLITKRAVVNFLRLNYAGSTWHIASEETDFGPVLVRGIVRVEPGDTVETLYPRLKKAEHIALIGLLKSFPF
ncbi:MAG: formyltransferase family protein [bacterium]|nr:formyltransferase family protein [bacterium]